MKFVSGEGYTVDDVYITELWPQVGLPTEDRIKVHWTVLIKPLALDDVLWAAFMPHETMGPRMRLNRRIDSGIKVTPLQIGKGAFEAGVLDDPEPHWEALLDEFEAVRTAFTASHPTAVEYLSAIRAADDRHHRSSPLREMVTLIAVGRPEEAAALSDAAVAAGEHGTMSTPTATVYEYISAYAKGAEAHERFMTSLLPTHEVELLAEHNHGMRFDVSRARYHRGFLQYLERFDGADVWGLILGIRQQGHNDPAGECYVQAAGSASAMTIEIRQPTDGQPGVVSVRSVVGHRHDGPSVPDVAVELPQATEMRCGHEIFEAEEAAGIFETYYRTDELPAGYTLRAADGFTADGTIIPLGA